MQFRQYTFLLLEQYMYHQNFITQKKLKTLLDEARSSVI
jgi:hypothetical protein